MFVAAGMAAGALVGVAVAEVAFRLERLLRHRRKPL